MSEFPNLTANEAKAYYDRQRALAALGQMVVDEREALRKEISSVRVDSSAWMHMMGRILGTADSLSQDADAREGGTND